MKINIKSLLLFSTLSTFFYFNTAFAGACSGHGGVDCLAGHDSDGSAICVDGWKDSSVQYSSLREVCNEEYLEIGPFIDITQSDVHRDSILFLFDKKIINGYPDLTFRPENPVNRAELLKILIEGKGITPSATDYNDCFIDVFEGWYEPYVCYAKSLDWIKGYDDGEFKAGNTVNKAEAIKMLLNSQNIEIPEVVSQKPFEDVESSEWYATYVFKAKELNILEENGNIFSPNQLMSRGGISENLYRLLNIK